MENLTIWYGKFDDIFLGIAFLSDIQMIWKI